MVLATKGNLREIKETYARMQLLTKQTVGIDLPFPNKINVVNPSRYNLFGSEIPFLEDIPAYAESVVKKNGRQSLGLFF